VTHAGRLASNFEFHTALAKQRKNLLIRISN